MSESETGAPTPAAPGTSREPGAPGVALQRLLVAAGALLVVSAYVVGRMPLSNIDDYAVRRFQVDFPGSLWACMKEEPAGGRFRLLYWLFEGGLGALTGSSGTVLYYGRLVLLGLSVVLLVRLGRRLGAPLGLAVIAAVAVGWSLPALAVWGRAGPAEAFATPLALASCLLVLGAESTVGVAVAGAVGLAACLTKESYAAWTAAALLAWAAKAFLARDLRGARWVAVAGAGAQFLPAALAVGIGRGWSGSYTQHVVSEISVGPVVAVQTAFGAAPVIAAAGLAGLGIVAARLRRTSASAWELADLAVIAMASAVWLEGVLLGFSVLRYLLPTVIVSVLPALRAARGWPMLRRPRLAAALLVLALSPVLVSSGVLVANSVARSVADSRVDERFRALLGVALSRYGAVRILWDPSDVERPVGAVTHLAAEGIHGEVQISPCVELPRGGEELYGELFAPYAKPPTRPGPVFISPYCPGAGTPETVELVCVTALPSLSGPPAGRGCFTVPEAAVVYGLR